MSAVNIGSRFAGKHNSGLKIRKRWWAKILPRHHDTTPLCSAAKELPYPSTYALMRAFLVRAEGTVRIWIGPVPGAFKNSNTS